MRSIYRSTLCLLVSLGISIGCALADEPARVTGERKKWHRVTVTLTGPATSENATPNPFRDYRLTVRFRHPGSKKAYQVPGYFASDGNAAETGADAGDQWRVHFTPDEVGEWTWQAVLHSGKDIAVALDEQGQAVPLKTSEGKFEIANTDKKAPDARARGRIQDVGKRYLQWAETGESFLKGGANSPENLLAYADFDATPVKHRYKPHEQDWCDGDPTWKKSQGKGLVGVVNYLAAQDMNVQYFLTMNVNGDGDDVWPWISRDARDRFDCSKLDQWEIVFAHMDAKGLLKHVVFNEQENDQLLNEGELGPERKLYYREMIARFGHHLALAWNLGEETTNTHAQHGAYLDYIRRLDPYQHPIVMYCFPGHYDRVYTPLLGNRHFTGPSLQLADMQHVHTETIKWLDRSITRGRQWCVCLDEIGPARDGVVPDALDPRHDAVRHRVLWGNLLAGGGGVEYYFGWGHPHHDRALEDYRSRANMWKQTRIALEFMRNHLPFTEMSHADGLTRSDEDYCFADPGRVYAVYLPRGGETELDLGSSHESFTTQWFNPREGGDLQAGKSIAGPGWKKIGPPPADPTKDWVLLVREVSFAEAYTGPGRVLHFTLMDCDTNEPVPEFNPITEGATLPLSKLPKRLALRANTEPAQVGSVQFTYDGKKIGEAGATAPFALPRDVNGQYFPWKFEPGQHTVTAIPFAQGGGNGIAGKPVILRLNVSK
ncbi:hypothetical protein Pla8534_43630 [Lignipirellula cremea]|uniref:DUF5060 domain-containing protein n=1 Tax=Lignipirellula cremea TaxID=2528010 RepID=A0A518DXI3_9BACT|nr:hypothetical protein Pla8534_43630 [Lignipirellula cremea]